MLYASCLDFVINPANISVMYYRDEFSVIIRMVCGMKFIVTHRDGYKLTLYDVYVYVRKESWTSTLVLQEYKDA